MSPSSLPTDSALHALEQAIWGRTRASDDLDLGALALNTRPRKSLGWKIPGEVVDYLTLSLTLQRCGDSLNPSLAPRLTARSQDA